MRVDAINQGKSGCKVSCRIQEWKNCIWNIMLPLPRGTFQVFESEWKSSNRCTRHEILTILFKMEFQDLQKHSNLLELMQDFVGCACTLIAILELLFLFHGKFKFFTFDVITAWSICSASKRESIPFCRWIDFQSDAKIKPIGKLLSDSNVLTSVFILIWNLLISPFSRFSSIVPPTRLARALIQQLLPAPKTVTIFVFTIFDSVNWVLC